MKSPTRYWSAQTTREWSGGEGERERAVHAPREDLDLAGRKIAAKRGEHRLLARLGREVGDAPRGVDLEEVRPEALERLRRDRFREAAVERHGERLVLLVAVAVEHDDDPLEPRQHAERVADDQFGILERDLRR
jgi:hypothetical protein